ncbi:MAG: hypothetical protein DRP13_02505 [Candidatus Aenigmatarchaeota archaeon]|nr:MAG: hypothetical protein DRP13_02505 [Candidatus Aenigmarchaeota archaeon]
MEEPKIIKNPEVFEEYFIPTRILHREDQLMGIRNDLKPLLSGKKPRNIVLYGYPGTGKTCIAKYVVDELRKEFPALYAYVNCWKEESGFKILYNISKNFSSSFIQRKGISKDELLDIIERKIQGIQGIVILDEFDKLSDERILYDLLSLSGITLILISNKPNALQWFDPRIRSRLSSADIIDFPLYKTEEILDILKDRREWGLIPGTVTVSQLERIAGASEGDARKGIEILRIASIEAENRDLNKITDDVIEKSIPKVPDTQKHKLDALNPYQKLILKVLNSKPMDSGNLFSELQSLSEKQGLERIVDRTFRKYMERLVNLGLVRASGKGRWRKYSKS